MAGRQLLSIADVAIELGRHDLLPAIVFRTSRSQCDLDAERAVSLKRMHLPAPEQREVQQRVKEIVRAYELDSELIISHPQYKSLITTGVGAHHAGQLLMWRLMLEELMAAGALRILVATGTVAAGVDFPARSVVITAHSRRGAEGFTALTAAEFQQMSGRAGRRGRDTVGFCIAAPTPFCDARVVQKIAHKPPEPLVSAYFPSPSTVLNLLRYRTVDGLRYTVERSLASFVDRREAASLREDAARQIEALSGPARAHWERQAAERQSAASSPGPQEAEQTDSGDDDIGRSPSGAPPLSRDDKKAIKRIKRLYRQADQLERRQVDLLNIALDGLRALGHLEGDNLSAKGFWAANLCTNLVLELAEIIESGLLADAGMHELVAIIASLSGDRHRTYLRASDDVVGAEKVAKLQEVLNHVRSRGMPGVLEEGDVVIDAAHTVTTWLKAEDWQQFRGLLFLSGVAEGDAARLITQTAEQLNQLARLSESHYELAMLAEEAKRFLLRPPLTEVINLDF